MDRKEIMAEYQQAIEQVEYDIRGKDEKSIKEQMEVFSNIDEKKYFFYNLSFEVFLYLLFLTYFPLSI